MALSVINENGFATALMEIGGLSEWMNDSRGGNWSMRSWRGTEAEHEFKFTRPVMIPGRVEARLDNETQLQFYFAMDADNSNVILTVQKIVRVWVTPPSPVKESDHFVRIARRLANFIALINNHQADPRYVIVHENDVQTGEHWREFNYGTLVLGGGVDMPFEPLEFRHPLVRYEDIKDRFPEMIASWFRLYDQAAYAMNAYFANSVEEANKHIETKYAVACMAFEAYYTSMNDDDPNLYEKLTSVMRKYEDFFIRDGTSEIDDLARRIVRARRAIVHNKGEEFSRKGYHHLFSLYRLLDALLQMQMLTYVGIDLGALNYNGDVILKSKVHGHRTRAVAMPFEAETRSQ